MFAVLKVLISGIVISYASWLAGRKPVLAGFIIALPFVSLLSIIFSYVEYRDMAKLNQFAVSILVSVPLSLTFFIPFVLNRWLKLNFPLTLIAGLSCLALAYLVHSFVFKTNQ
jgi:hypothetical protein